MAACECALPAGRDRVQRGRLCAEHRVGSANQFQQVGIEIELANRDDVHERHTNVALKQRGDLGDKCPPALGTVLVGRTDDFDRRDQPPTMTRIVDPHFILILVGQFGFQREGRFRRRPRRDGDTTVSITWLLLARWLVSFVG